MRLLLIFIFSGILFWGCTFQDENKTSVSFEEKGDNAFARRDYSNAINIWGKVFYKDQKNIKVIKKISDAYLKLGRIEKAQFFLNKAVEADPGNIDIQIQMIQLHILSGELDQADKGCRKLEKEGIAHPELDLIKADLSLLTGQFDLAETYYRKAVIGSKDSIRMLMKLAIFLKSRKRHEEALEIIKLVEKTQVVTTKRLMLLSDFYLLDHQEKLAEQYIQNAIKMEPEDNSLKTHLVQFYIETGQLSKAEQSLKALLENQDDDYLKMMLADLYIVNGQPVQADQIILELKNKLNEPIVEFELLQGKYWLYSGRPVYATSHLNSALDLKPGLVHTRYLLGVSHLINGKNKLSENSLNQTLLIDPNHYKALILLSELLYKQGEYELSLNYLDRVLKNYPEDFTARIVKGLNLIEQKKYMDAIQIFKDASKLTNSVYIPNYYLGMTYQLNNQNTNALEYYKLVLEDQPDLIDASYRYCMLLIETNQAQVAQQFINEKLKNDQGSAYLYYIAAMISSGLKQFETTEAYLKKSVMFNDAPGFVYMALAEFYKQRKSMIQSIAVLKECTQKNPIFHPAWLALSKYYEDNQDFIAAIEIMEAGYKLFPESSVFQSNLSWLLLENEVQIDRALSLAQTAYEKNPENIAFADTLGWAYFHKGIYSQACWLLSEALKKAPENGFVLYHLGMTYEKQGEMENALSNLAAAKKTKEYIYFSRNLDMVLSRLSNDNAQNSLLIGPKNAEDLLSPPKNERSDDDMLVPQWKQ